MFYVSTLIHLQIAKCIFLKIVALFLSVINKALTERNWKGISHIIKLYNTKDFEQL